MQVPGLRRAGEARDMDALHPGIRHFCKANSCLSCQVFSQGLSGVRRAGTDLSSAGHSGCSHPWGMGMLCSRSTTVVPAWSSPGPCIALLPAPQSRATGDCCRPQSCPCGAPPCRAAVKLKPHPRWPGHKTPVGLRWMGSATRALCLFHCQAQLFLSTTQALSLSGL